MVEIVLVSYNRLRKQDTFASQTWSRHSLVSCLLWTVPMKPGYSQLQNISHATILTSVTDKKLPGFRDPSRYTPKWWFWGQTQL